MFRIVCLLALVFASVVHQAEARTTSFADFARRRQAGERLTVVFFGASLTWARTRPIRSRPRTGRSIAQRLQKQYPEARFTFWDAAIGGTGSQLGVFRFDRDVARHRPDLVFLDFSANDDIGGSADSETLALYESLVRRAITDLHVPVVQVIFPFQWNVSGGTLDGMLRRDAHLAIGKAYNTAVGDAIAWLCSGSKTSRLGWKRYGPLMACILATRATFCLPMPLGGLSGRGQNTLLAAPEKMLHGETYLKNSRVRISSLGQLPVGWQVGRPNVVSAYFDMLMSRW